MSNVTPNEHSTAQAAEHEPALVHEEVLTVEVERSVHYNRILIAGLVLGALFGAALALIFPTDPAANYTMGQVAGFTAVLGAAAGLLLSGVFALILGRIAKRSRGTALVKRSDIR